jgi:gamma-glutamyltranspeptidase
MQNSSMPHAVRGEAAMVASGHPLAARAAADLLSRSMRRLRRTR